MKDISKVGVLTQRLVVSGYSEFARCMALIQYIIQLFDSNLFPAPACFTRRRV